MTSEVKWIIFITILLVATLIFACNVYYLNTISENNNGTFLDSARETISKIKSQHFFPGDSTFLIIEKTWREKNIVSSSSIKVFPNNCNANMNYINNEIRMLIDDNWEWKTEAGAAKLINDMVESGLNTLVVEVWHGAGVRYPSQDYIMQDSSLETDTFQYLIELAHANGIEVHASFTVARRATEIYKDYYDNGTPSGSYDIHRPNFREFISDLIEYTVINYDIKGVNLSHIRTRCDYNHRWDKSTFDVNQYENELYPGRSLSDDIDASSDCNLEPHLQEWHDSAVYDAVQRIHDKVMIVNPNIEISVLTYEESCYSQEQGRKAWRWVNDGLVNYAWNQLYENDPAWYVHENGKNNYNDTNKLKIVLNIAYEDFSGPKPTNDVIEDINYVRLNYSDHNAFGLYSSEFFTDSLKNQLGSNFSPLTATIDASPTSGWIPLTVSFIDSVTGGTEPYTYKWNFGDGEASSEHNPSHTYNEEGNYTVNLTVTDSNNNQASDSIIITATAPIEPLSVSTSASPTSGVVPLTVSFSVNANGGASPYSYNWDFGDGASSSEQNPSHTYNQAGTYNVTLTVTDSESSQATDSLAIEASSNPTFTLNISSVTGSPALGSGGTTDPDPGSHSYSQGTSVKVKAVPNSGYRFSKWSGDVSSSDAYDEEISISLDNDKSISAYFFTKCGDVNGDLSITAADAQWAFDIYLGRIADPTESEKENADVTCDGTTTSPNVTPADAHAIFEKFIGRNELPCDCSCKSRTASYQAQASQVRDVAIFVDSILFNESNEIVVPVAVDKPFNIYTFGFDLVYPSDVLEFVAVEVPEEIKDYFMVDANKIADGVIRAGGFRKSFNLIHNPRTLIKLIFRVIEEAKDTISFNITNTVDDIKNASFRSRRVEEKKTSYRR